MTLAMRVAMCVAACYAASPAASPAQLVAEGRFGFVGLGTMGYHMAGHLVSAGKKIKVWNRSCLLYTSPSPRDRQKSRMPSSA